MTESLHKGMSMARRGGEVGRAPRLLDEVRARMRRLGLSRRTEEAYVGWIRRFILANGKRHPRELGRREVEAFLTLLAVKGNVAAATQNQALAALLFIHWLRRKIVAATRIISDQNLELQAAYEQLTAQNEELIAQGEELMSSEAKSKALLQATPDMIVRLSREGIYREIYIPQGTEIFNLHSMRTGQSI